MTKMTDAELRKRAFRKRRQGEALTAEEQEAFREYYRDRAKLRCMFYCVDGDERHDLEAHAESDGFTNFGEWLRAMVHRGRQSSTRTEDEWDDVLARLEKAEARFEDQLSMTHELMEKAGRYERERDDARAEATELRNALLATGGQQ